jgi:hypothetical protein
MRGMHALLCIIVITLVGCSDEKVSQIQTIGEKVAQSESVDQEWGLSPIFKSALKDSNGNSIPMTLLGKENRIAVLYDEKINPFIAGKPQKYLWFFWGQPEKLNGNMGVEAVKKDTGEKINIFETNSLAKEDRADASAPSLMEL